MLTTRKGARIPTGILVLLMTNGGLTTNLHFMSNVYDQYLKRCEVSFAQLEKTLYRIKGKLDVLNDVVENQRGKSNKCNPQPLEIPEETGNSTFLIVTNQTLGHTYSLSLGEERLTWPEARAACLQRGFHLARIENESEHQYLISLRERLPLDLRTRPWWIDGTDLGHEGCWVWTTPLMRGFSGGYVNWNDGEPSNSGDNEHCLEISLWMSSLNAYKWNDVPCTDKKNYLCKQNLGTVVKDMASDQEIEDMECQ